MAHMLEMDEATGKAFMAYTGEVPWHGLGTPVQDGLSPEEFMKVAGLDWEVVKCPQFYRYNAEECISDDVALVRTSDGKQLSSVSADWEVCQNNEAFRFFAEFIEGGGMKMHTAGSLHGGKRVWILAKIDEAEFKIFGNDVIAPYLLFTNPHWYGQVIDIRLTPVRAVCDNTVTLALSGRDDLAVRLHHRRKFDPEFVKDTLGIASKKLEEFKSTAEFLGGRRYSATDVVEYLKQVFPAMANDPQEREKLSRPARLAFHAVDNQPGANYAEGSWWQVYNGVTFVTNHLLNRSNPSSRLESCWYGNNRMRNNKAMKLAIEYAEKSPALALAA